MSAVNVKLRSSGRNHNPSVVKQQSQVAVQAPRSGSQNHNHSALQSSTRLRCRLPCGSPIYRAIAELEIARHPRVQKPASILELRCMASERPLRYSPRRNCVTPSNHQRLNFEIESLRRQTATRPLLSLKRVRWQKSFQHTPRTRSGFAGVAINTAQLTA